MHTHASNNTLLEERLDHDGLVLGSEGAGQEVWVVLAEDGVCVSGASLVVGVLFVGIACVEKIIKKSNK